MQTTALWGEKNYLEKSLHFAFSSFLDKISKLVMPNRRCRSTTMFLAQRRQLIFTEIPTVIVPKEFYLAYLISIGNNVWMYLASCWLAWRRKVKGNLVYWRKGNNTMGIQCAFRCRTPKSRCHYPSRHKKPKYFSRSSDDKPKKNYIKIRNLNFQSITSYTVSAGSFRMACFKFSGIWSSSDSISTLVYGTGVQPKI